MSTLSYKLIRLTGYPFFWVATRPTVLHRDRARLAGAYILAANHQSPYDIPALMAASPRDLDFVSIVEFRRNPLMRLLIGGMNAVYLDRRRVDMTTTRQILRKLAAGRVVAMFPEGGFRKEPESVMVAGRINPGVVRLAQAAGVPIVPCVILDTGVLSRFTKWLPIRGARYGVIFGEPMVVGNSSDADAARTRSLDALRGAYRSLYVELCTTMNRAPVIASASERVSSGASDGSPL